MVWYLLFVGLLVDCFDLVLLLFQFRVSCVMCLFGIVVYCVYWYVTLLL